MTEWSKEFDRSGVHPIASVRGRLRISLSRPDCNPETGSASPLSWTWSGRSRWPAPWAGAAHWKSRRWTDPGDDCRALRAPDIRRFHCQTSRRPAPIHRQPGGSSPPVHFLPRAKRHRSPSRSIRCVRDLFQHPVLPNVPWTPHRPGETWCSYGRELAKTAETSAFIRSRVFYGSNGQKSPNLN